MSPVFEQVLSAFPTIVAFDFLRYLAGAGLVALVLAMLGAAAARRRIQSRRPSGADIRRELLASAGTTLIFAVNGALIMLLALSGVASITEALPGPGLLLVEVAGLIVLHDAWFYWTHRTLHHRRLFAAHRLHHLSRTPSPWAAYAFAPAEAVVQAALLTLVVLVAPLHGLAIFLFLTQMILRNALGHAGHELMPPGFTRHWLGRWFTTTVHHDLHHSEGRHNFGLYFTWWDRLMGTEHPDYHARFAAAARPWGRVPAVAAGLAVMLMLASAAPGLAAPVEGLWVTPGFGSVVEVRSAGAELDARIRWLWAPGKGALGQPLFERFGQKDGQWQGRILNPEDGRTYHATLRPEGTEWMVVKGCVGPFCREQRWRRLAPLLQALPR